MDNLAPLHDCAPDTAVHRREVLEGLRRTPKELPSKLFYDAAGSKLFDQICELEEYYPTRTELGIMSRSVGEMVALLGDDCLLIEYGSGSSQKTHVLLDAWSGLAGYVPVDISKQHLWQSAQRIAAEYPQLPVLPVAADYTQSFTLPDFDKPISHRVVYFPGSTIGNFKHEAAQAFLGQIAELVGESGGLLIGVDLKKDPVVLHAAYNDALGITAAFNLNMLTHLNRAVGSDFDVDAFRHRAIYNEVEGRIEMHLVSEKAQVVAVAGEQIAFEEGEWIWTESSYKYTLAEFESLAGAVGWRVEQVWTDENKLFSVQYLSL
ncbi:MAG TPA: L-histidine N(alpha)-methyltransferase [Anaerolineae bacterium]|nr:L-histidine N(alpha)-methyltransferase [Anaerolineae bacterium]